MTLRLSIQLLVALVATFVTGGAPVPPVLAQSDARPELTVGFSVGPATLDPRREQAISFQSVLRHMYEPLLYHDRQGTITPSLATSWKFIDPLTLELKLRTGVRFHNGEAFDAQSVKYTIDSINAPDSKAINKFTLANVARVDTPDSHTVRLVLKTPSRAQLRTLTFWPLGMLPPKAAAELGDRLGTVSVGTGPYRLGEYVPGEKLVLLPHDGYWGGKPAYSKITVRIIPENGTRIAALESGEAMMINNVPPDQIQRLGANATLTIISRPTTRNMFVAFNWRKQTIATDPRVRQAVSLAIDRSELVKGVLNGTAPVSRSPLAPAIFGAVTFEASPYNPTRAKQLLQDAGYKGERLEFWVPNGRYLNDKLVGEAIGGYLQAAGFNVAVRVVEWGQFVAETIAGKGKDWDMAFFGYSNPPLEPDYSFNLFHSKFDQVGYSNPSYDALVEKARGTIDEREAAPIYEEIQRVLWRETPYVFLYFQPQIDAVNKRLRGYEPMPDEYMFFTGTSLVAR